MLKNKLKIRLSLAVPALLAASQVSAHPGGHEDVTMLQLIEHMLASPFHAGVITVAVIAVAFTVHKLSKHKASKVNKSD